MAVSEPAVHFTGDEWLRIALILLATLLYASLFYLLGLWLSVRVDRPATGLVVAISIWAVFTVVVPTGIGVPRGGDDAHGGGERGAGGAEAG